MVQDVSGHHLGVHIFLPVGPCERHQHGHQRLVMDLSLSGRDIAGLTAPTSPAPGG